MGKAMSGELSCPCDRSFYFKLPEIGKKKNDVIHLITAVDRSNFVKHNLGARKQINIYRNSLRGDIPKGVGMRTHKVSSLSSGSECFRETSPIRNECYFCKSGDKKINYLKLCRGQDQLIIVFQVLPTQTKSNIK